MNQHPELSLIKSLVTGTLISPLAAMVSSHVDLCPDCQHHYKESLQMEAFKADHLNTTDISVEEINSSFDLMMNKMMMTESAPLPQTDQHSPMGPKRGVDEKTTLEVSGQVILLPRSWAFLKDHKIPWKEFGKKNAIAPLSLGLNGNFYLIYIGPGESVPMHDHSGREYSYVAAGSYDDGRMNLSTGDFSISSQGEAHSPKATSSDGCLVISWVEGRLNYFSGILKPLNSILWWYLHRA